MSILGYKGENVFKSIKLFFLKRQVKKLLRRKRKLDFEIKEFNKIFPDFKEVF